MTIINPISDNQPKKTDSIEAVKPVNKIENIKEQEKQFSESMNTAKEKESKENNENQEMTPEQLRQKIIYDMNKNFVKKSMERSQELRDEIKE